MDDSSSFQFPGTRPLQPNPVTQRAHRKEALLQIFLPVLVSVTLLGLAVYFLIQSQFASVERWSEISSMVLIAMLIVVLFVPLLLVLTFIYIVTKLLSILPISALQAQIAIDKVKRQIHTGADISVQPMIQIQSFLATIEALFGRRS